MKTSENTQLDCIRNGFELQKELVNLFKPSMRKCTPINQRNKTKIEI
jgi:hypothetical protein